jgi:hypothetical protein
MENTQVVISVNADETISLIDGFIQPKEYKRVALVVYFFAVGVSFANAFRFLPESLLKTFTGALGLAVIISLGLIVRYSLTFALFYCLVRYLRGISLSSQSFAAIVLCNVPNILLILFSVTIPGFGVIDSGKQIAYSVTSLAFVFYTSVSSDWLMQMLAAVEVFNISTLMLLAFYLRRVSGFRILSAFLINLSLDLVLRVLPSMVLK